MNTLNNKRGQEFLQKIEAAFVTLLQEKPFHEVEVSELCELAQINRSTFYAHYEDLFELANAYAAKVEQQLKAQAHIDGEFDWIFEYINSNTDQFQTYFKLGISQPESDYKKLFFKNGVFAVAKMWFEAGCKETPKQMGGIIKREYEKAFET